MSRKIAARSAATTNSSTVATPPRARGYVPTGIAVTGITFRSASVERDDAELVDTYVLTEPALDLLHRITATIAAGRAGAWSITGAYGTGKSSFAVLLAALLAPDTPSARGTSSASATDSHERAFDLVAAADPALAETLRGAVTDRPLLRALVTARREPIGRTVARALQTAGRQRWGRRIPSKVAQALSALEQSGGRSAGDGDRGGTPDAAAVLHAVVTMASAAPLLLVIDEFGKSLEHFAGHADDANAGSDLYLLQELAELASNAGSEHPTVYLLTLQHASFLDYAARTEALQRREWSKIQGRFQDVAFAAGPGDAAALVAGALDQSHLSDSDAAALRDYGAAAADRAAEHGLDAVVVTDPDVLRASYPLHPMTLAALPLLAGALGQHDRTLGGFVAGDEPHGVARFLASWAGQSASDGATVDVPNDEAPAPMRTLQVPGLWDYFATAVRGPALASSSASRWIEIETRLSEAHGLPDLDFRILKTVAVLNLVDSSGCLRAGRANIVFALTDPQHSLDGQSDHAAAIAERLEGLVGRGFLTYRAFSDEYRLWRGSTVDLPARLQAARDELTDRDVAALIQRSYAPTAIVAGRHSQTTGMLRHFQARVSDGTGGAVDTATVLGPADGTVLFHLGGSETVPDLDVSRPVLVGISSDADHVIDAGREVAALDAVLDTENLDPPAHTEAHERLSVARSDLAATLAAAFRPDRGNVSWHLRLPTHSDRTPDRKPVELGRARSLSALVSAACDRAYPQSPQIRNEMLGRHQLTSQGAKARRELLTALLEHPATERAGIVGHGPDRAMYDGVVDVLGLHGPTDSSPTGYGWTTPQPGDLAHPAWAEAINLLRSANTPITVDVLHLRLSAPPFGVKAGVVPLLLVAALVHTADDVAIFEDGSFVARVTGDLVERMVKTPQRFAVRYVPSGQGQRQMVLVRLHDSILSAELSVATATVRHTRNTSLVKLVVALLDVIRGLSSYSMKTADLPAPARAVREALSTVRDPAELIFTALPAAVGHPEITATDPTDADEAEALIRDLLTAVDDLRTADRRLAEWAAERLAEAFNVHGELTTVRRDLAARARVIRGGLADPTLASFLTHAQREDVPDDDWLDAAILIIARIPLSSWRDSDTQAFPDRVRQLARTFDRVYELYFDSARSTGDPFDARRVTLTRPDGAEHHVVIGLPGTSSSALAAFVDDLLARADGLDDVPGPARGHTVLAALAERLLDPDSTGRPPSEIETRRAGSDSSGDATPGLAATGPATPDTATRSSAQRRLNS